MMAGVAGIVYRCLLGFLPATFYNMKRLGYRSAFVSTVRKVDLKTKSSQTIEPQLFYFVCYRQYSIVIVRMLEKR